jgi:outer membrane protein OmpA-like peptidoglycan-associated protein
MIFLRQVVVAAASFFAAAAVMPSAVWSDDRAPAADTDNDKRRHEPRGRSNDQQGPATEQRGDRGDRGDRGERGERRGSFARPQAGDTANPSTPPAFKNQAIPGAGPKNFGNSQPPNAGPKNFGNSQPPNAAPNRPQERHQPAVTTVPPQTPPAVKDTAKVPPPNTFKPAPRDNTFKAEDRNRPDQKHFGDRDRGTVNKPVVVNPPTRTPGVASPPPKALSAGDARKRFDTLRSERKEKVEAGGKVVIQEPGNRTMFKQNNRLVIQHDETERLKRVNPNARFQKGPGGVNVSIIDRPGNVKIYSETDAHGQLVRRYRRGPDGRDVIIIDNRRRHGGKGLATGIGIGLGVVAGAAILNSFVDVPEPRVRIPRDKYIVEYEGASDEDVYDALSAPPIEDFRDRYTLDEIRATARLRDRMRRVDLDDINFEFGSWDVDPSEYHKLGRIARAMMRVINRNPNEVFLIEGYTDAVGSDEDNLSLSDRRAESVAEVLTEEFQVPFENLTTQGYGEEFLKVQTQAPERLNRRVAVRRITPLLARDDGPGNYQRRSDNRAGAYDNRASSGRDDPRDQPEDDSDDQGNGNSDSGRGFEYSPYRGGTNPD